MEEVSEAAYEKACEVVAETVQAETVKADLEVIDDYRTWATAPERKSSPEAKTLIGKVLDAVQNKLKNAARNILQRVSERLHEPAVKEANKAEIKSVTKKSIMEKLHMARQEVAAQPASTPKKKLNKGMEH